MFTRLLLLLVLGATLVPPVGGGLPAGPAWRLAAPVPAPQAKATVLVFIAHDCPIANGYAPEIQRLASHYGAQKIAFYLVYVEPDLSVNGAKRHEAAYGYHLPALRDTRHVLVQDDRRDGDAGGRGACAGRPGPVPGAD